jgi:hypothetical protein
MSQNVQADRPNGPVAAALLAGGLGAATLGVMTILGESITSVGTALNWWNPAGSLVGKTGVAVIAMFASWLVLHFVLKDKEINFGRVTTVALILLLIGILGTFPPFFDLFAKH